MAWFATAVKTLFGNSKLDLGEKFDTVAKGIDKLKLTEQEKNEGIVQFVTDTLSENSERSKTRRTVSKIIVINTIVLAWFLIILALLGHELTSILKLVSIFHLGEAFLMVLAFFYSGYYINKYRNNKKPEKNNTNQ